jgi:hypothetical protein
MSSSPVAKPSPEQERLCVNCKFLNPDCTKILNYEKAGMLFCQLYGLFIENSDAKTCTEFELKEL